jgi:hypothetical protein
LREAFFCALTYINLKVRRLEFPSTVSVSGALRNCRIGAAQIMPQLATEQDSCGSGEAAH